MEVFIVLFFYILYMALPLLICFLQPYRMVSLSPFLATLLALLLHFTAIRILGCIFYSEAPPPNTPGQKGLKKIRQGIHYGWISEISRDEVEVTISNYHFWSFLCVCGGPTVATIC